MTEELVENPFPSKAQKMINTLPLTREQSELLIMLLYGQKKEEEKEITPEKEKSLSGNFFYQILKKRMDILKLPISFSEDALLYLLILAKTPGMLIVILIDCLSKYEGQLVTSKKLVDLYPYGFYNQEVATDYIYNYIQPKRVKWAEIY